MASSRSQSVIPKYVEKPLASRASVAKSYGESVNEPTI